MARIFGVSLPDDKNVAYGLTLIYGIGWQRAREILRATKIDPNEKIGQLSEEKLRKITDFIEKNYKVEGELREEIMENVKRLKEIGCYRGIRHLRGLPVRGQRTRSNARTKRGKRKTVGALRKEVWAKLEQEKQKKQSTTSAKSSKK